MGGWGGGGREEVYALAHHLRDAESEGHHERKSQQAKWTEGV